MIETRHLNNVIFFQAILKSKIKNLKIKMPRKERVEKKIERNYKILLWDANQ